MEDCFVVVSMTIQNADNDLISAIKSVCKLHPAVKVSIKKTIADELKAVKAEYTRKFKSSFEFLFLGWLFALQKSVVIQIQLELPVHLLRFLKEKRYCWCCKEQCIVRLLHF